MLKSSAVKKIRKHFDSFSEEEQWLQSMLNEGWILKQYDSEDLDACQYVFEPVQHMEQKNRIYKIDYRNFNTNNDYQEYKSIFEDTGWTVLSKNKGYSKHIFYTELQNANHTIFSDPESYKEREKRKMSTLLIYIIISTVLLIVSIILYNIYERTSFLGAGAFLLIIIVKCMIDYFKHRKDYKSLV